LSDRNDVRPPTHDLILRCGRSKIAEPRRRAPESGEISEALLRGRSIVDGPTLQDEVVVGKRRVFCRFDKF